MKARMLLAVALLGVSAGSASAQAPIVFIAPIVLSIPTIARLATDKKLPPAACSGELLVHKKDEIVCIMPGTNWSSYGSVEVASVEIVPADTRRPLTEKEMALLKTTLTNSLEKQFGTGEENTGTRKLLLRARVFEVRRTNKTLNIVTLAAIQTQVSFGGASTHFELADGETGQTVAEIDISRRGRMYDLASGTCSLGHARKALSRTPKQLNKNLQSLRSKPAIQTASIQQTDTAESN
jgi:hypothetical protein